MTNKPAVPKDDPFARLVLDAVLGIEVTEDDLLALLDAESAMGEPPAIGAVDFESGAAVRFDPSEDTF